MLGKRPYKNRVEVLQGTLDMLILQALQWGPMHGYGIAQTIRLKSSEVLQVETGSLYPALHRLERQRWVKAEWKITDSKQRAKFYKITALGKEQLLSDHERWGRSFEPSLRSWSPRGSNHELAGAAFRTTQSRTRRRTPSAPPDGRL